MRGVCGANESEIGPMKKLFPLFVLICIGLVVIGSLMSRPSSAPGVATASVAKGAELGADGIGETIYVPVYSQIHYEDGRSTLELAATLSIHNIDPDRKIVVTQADYYNTSGKLLERYVEGSLVLNPLETKHIVVEKRNTAGGVGANFLVKWQADEPTAAPLVEALMVNASHNLGIAFTSPGKAVKPLGTASR